MESYVVESFGQPLTRLLRPTPVPTGSKVLIKVRSCGVCHSDVHMHDGYFDLGASKLDMTRFMPLPRALGHEIAGTVVAIGPNAEGVRVGDQRVVYPWIGCGSCPTCAAGEEQLCNAPNVVGVQQDGGFADHVLVPHARYTLPYGRLLAEQACTLACAGITAYSAVKKVMLAQKPQTDSEPLLIIGAGGVGLSAIRLARHLMPHTPLIVAELDAAKRALAIEAGAAEAFDPNAEGASKALMKRTGGGVLRAIDFVGAAATFTFGFGALRKGGTMVCVGLFGGTAALMPVLLAMKAVTLMGSYVGTLSELAELIALSQQHPLPPLPVSVRPLHEASQALDDLREGRVQGRVVLHTLD
jgi:D-arabinose 1-dehydrogenase-like Zn-dependent alcohol dehydrogenase